MSDVTLSKAVRSNLLTLQNTAAIMGRTQERLATGNKVNSALDNPTNFFTASALNARAGDMGSLLDAMASGVQTIEAANNGLTAITKNVESMQSTLRQARQDKSFQVETFDVTDASILKLTGGQLGDVVKDIKLVDAVAGQKASLTTNSATEYLGPNVSTTSSTSGTGARTLINTTNGFAAAGTFTVAGVSVTTAAADTSALIAGKIQAALDASSEAGKYVVTAGTGGNLNNVIIEAVDPTAAAAVVNLDPDNNPLTGIAPATKGSVSFNYKAVPGSITVGTPAQNVATGASFDEFVANLKAGATAGKYSVEADKLTGDIKVTQTDWNPAAPVIPEIPAHDAGSARVDTYTVTTTAAGGDTFTLDGQTLTFPATPADANDTAAQIRSFIQNNAVLSAKYAVSGGTNTITLTEKAKDGGFTGTAPVPGETGSIAMDFATGAGTADPTVWGFTNAAGQNGAYTSEVPAEKDEFTVSYGGKTASIAITGIKGGIGSTVNALDKAEWRAETVASVNAQLEAAGIADVEAKFDASGKFSIVAKNAEAQTLAISGKDAVDLFGSDTVNTGKAAVSGLNATKTVDKFVELINRDHGAFVRASNDNGKLRLENLSTQEMSVGVDLNNNGVVTEKKIAGNTVRANQAKQFNDLRDQLDKLSDDASFNGINLLRGDQLTITFNESGSSSIKIQAKDQTGNVRGITASNLAINSLEAEDLDTDAGIDKLLAQLSGALSELRSQASTFGSNLSSVENRQDFTKKMINTLETGAANLTLADTNEEAANLLALQTRQQLASQSLSMASQADQAVLRLFG